MPKGRPRLTRSTIVSTAIQMADERGLEAVSLRGISERLGVHVTSLYNHVPTKDAVLAGMVQALMAEARLPTGSLAWQDWIRRFAVAMRSLARRHPGAFQAFHYGPAQGERAAETFESAFAAFRSAGFEAVSAYSAVKATIVAVLGFALEETAPSRAVNIRTDIAALPVERFPNVHEISRVVDDADIFHCLVEALISGFAANRRAGRVAGAARGGRRRRAPRVQ